MNRRQAKKKQTLEYLKYLEYLDRYFDENEKWCILNNCPYYDHSGRYGGGCADQLAPKECLHKLMEILPEGAKIICSPYIESPTTIYAIKKFDTMDLLYEPLEKER